MGAYPGHARNDIQSGTGVVGNAAMFDRPQKSIVRGPFRARPKPPWFATATDSYDVMRRFVAFEAEPSAAKIPGSAVRRHAPLAAGPAPAARSAPARRQLHRLGAQLRNREGAAATSAAIRPTMAPNPQPIPDPPGLSMKAIRTRTTLTIVAIIITVEVRHV